jgi:hypothetical protein
MNFSDQQLLLALVHDANVMLSGHSADDLGHDADVEHVKIVLKAAERILSGKATQEERASVPGLVHPQVRSLYLAPTHSDDS